jgi:G protein-coupled receptor Mth (Methuselah protein)
MLHWKCQTGHVSCLLLGDILLAVTQLSDDRVSGGVCFTLGESLESLNMPKCTCAVIIMYGKV